VFQPVLTFLKRLPRRTAERWAEFRGYTPTDRNLFYLCIEVIPAGFAIGMVGFNAPFVLKLGGGSTLISLMLSLPALMAILVSVPFGKFMERQTNRKPYIVGALVVTRATFVLIGFVPWVLPQPMQPYAIVGLVVLQAIPLALFNSGWLSLMADLCPPDRRSIFFSMRWLLISVSWGISSFFSGLWLEYAPFPINYQALNFAGFVAAQCSTYLASRPIYPTYTVEGNRQKDKGKQNNPREVVRGFREFAREHRPYVNLNIATLVTFIGVWGAAPLLTLYFVDTLKLNEGWLGVNGFLSQAGTALGAYLGSQVIRRTSSNWVLKRILVVFWLYPLLIVLLPNPSAIWVFSFLGIALDPVMNVTLLNALYDLIPEQRRSSWMSSHVALMNVGAMLAPLLTVVLANTLSVQVALVACAVVRLVGVGLFLGLALRK
jgi:MFS family permease